MIPAHEALARLKQGNRQFATGLRENTTHRPPAVALVQQQQPFAVILGCADARVPAETVFNQGLGALFVIRVAGNIAAASQIGSVEYAAQALGTRLVVVMGHTGCGAVQATVDALLDSKAPPSPNLRAIVERVRPAVEPLMRNRLRCERDAIVQQAVRANIDRAVAQLRENSDILAGLWANEGLRIVGAEYALDTGDVTFFDRDQVD